MYAKFTVISSTSATLVGKKFRYTSIVMLYSTQMTMDALDVVVFVGMMVYAWFVILPLKTISPSLVMFMFGHPIGRFISITAMAVLAQYGFLLTAFALGLYILVCQKDLEASLLFI
jgi:hypothetical protein